MTFLESVWHYRLYIAATVFVLFILRFSAVYRNRLFGPKSKLIKHNEYKLDNGNEVFLVSIKGEHQDLGHLFHLMRLYDLHFITYAELVLLSRRKDLPRGISIVNIPADTAFMMHTDCRPPHAIVKSDIRTLVKKDKYRRYTLTRRIAVSNTNESRKKDLASEPSSTPA